MSAIVVREAIADDAASWLSLLKVTLGEDHPAKEVYDPSWITSELAADTPSNTWIAEADGQIQASVTFLSPLPQADNPVMNLGRNLFRPESFDNGSASELIKKIHEFNADENYMQVVRVLASDVKQQSLFEEQGYVCIGFQPFKHLHRAREGVLFYLRAGAKGLEHRLPLSESLPQIGELCTISLKNCGVTPPSLIRDGVTGYPLKTEISFQDSDLEEYDLWLLQSQSANPPREISGSFNLGFGYMRVDSNPQIKAALGKRDTKVVGGITYYYDEHDRCARIVDGFATDDLSMGALLKHAIQVAQDSLSAVYVEIDILSNAPRLIKSAEQLGFEPVAYMPAFHAEGSLLTDVVKLVKLNTSYALENTSLTDKSEAVVKVVDYNFQDQKTGIAIINLLRGLPIFEGLGDGELRKIARLFTQKLYRPGEKVFKRGSSGNEAYAVMRGKIDICLEEGSAPVASLSDGQIFGEQAFLDGAERVAMAVADKPSILLVMQRNAFYDVVQREPHLGMVVMRNIAMDLSNKLRRANTAIKR